MCYAWGDEKYTTSHSRSPEWMKPLGRSKHRWEKNNETDAQETGGSSVRWVRMAQDAVQWRDIVNKVMKHRVTRAKEAKFMTR
jgi:hypothetical protein